MKVNLINSINSKLDLTMTSEGGANAPQGFLTFVPRTAGDSAFCSITESDRLRDLRKPRGEASTAKRCRKTLRIFDTTKKGLGQGAKLARGK